MTYPQTLTNELEFFFSKLRDALPLQISPTVTPSYHYLSDLVFLNQWLTGLSEPLAVAQRGGFLCDPWEIAGLKRDEVRNSRVLAWLLDPRGSHGFGDLFILSLFAELGRRAPMLDFPIAPDKGCRVRIENSPDSNGNNRLDIEIDAANLYLIIEIKIDAPEGTNQLERYGKVGLAQAANRPWAIVYLTPRGKKPRTALNFEDKVIPLSWRDLSSILSRSLRAKDSLLLKARAHEKLTQLLAKRFLVHVRNF